MKQISLLIFSKKRSRLFSKLSLSFIAMFMMTMSAFAQINIDNSATASAVTVPDTILMHTDCYRAEFTHASAVLTDEKMDVVQANNWAEYKITTAATGLYNVVFQGASKNTNAKLNVALYSTDGTLLDAGATYPGYTGDWWNVKAMKYPFTLEAGVEYIIRMTQLDQGTNIAAPLVVEAADKSSDATLSTLTIDGVEVDGFNTAIYLYTILPGEGATTLQIGAEANSSVAMVAEGDTGVVSIPDDGVMDVLVTAEDGTELTYTINILKPMKLEPGTTIQQVSDAYYTHGTGGNDGRINDLKAGEYLEYYVYSETDQTLGFVTHFGLSVDDGAPQSILNVSTYPLGTPEDQIDISSNQVELPNVKDWGNNNIATVNVDFVANEPVILRAYVVSNAHSATIGNLYGFSISAPLDSVQTDKIRMVPTVEGDASTEFSIIDHNTGINGTIVVKNDNSFDSIKKGSWGKFQIKSATTGDFDVKLNVSSGTSDGEIYISLYNTLTGAWVADSDTANTATGSWNNKEDRYFRLPLEADVLYTMQINFITASSWVCNVFNVSVEEYAGGADASLSNLQMEGTTIDGFSSATMSYEITLPKGTTDVPAATATASIDGAKVEIMNAATISDTSKVVVTSVDGTVINTYMVTFVVEGPYMGVAAPIPGRVEFEYYDIGGEGVAFHDTGGKSGDGTFRPGDAIDVEGNKYTQRNVGWTGAGEWMEYTVNVHDSADYIVRMRIASNTTGDIIVYFDGDSVATYTPPATGGWQTYAVTDFDTATIAAGEHTIRMEFAGNVKLNVDYFELINVDSVSSDASLAAIELTDSTTLDLMDGKKSFEIIVDSLEAIPTLIYPVPNHWGAMVSVSQAMQEHGSTATIIVKAQDMMAADTTEITFLVAGPYSGSPAAIPGIIQFELYDIGGEGVSFHDDAVKRLDQNFRPNDMVDVEGSDSTYWNVGYTAAGEWLTYTVNVVDSGDYQLRTNVSNNKGTGKLVYYVDGDSIGSYMPSNSNAWHNYKTEIMDTITLDAGEHLIKVEYADDVKFNLDYFQFLNINNISADATLSTIALNDSVNVVDFDAATLMYTVKVDSLEEISTMVSAVTADANASMVIVQASKVDSSKAVITVTSQDMQTVTTYEVMFVLKDYTGVNEVYHKADVKLYPNPANEVLNVTSEHKILSINIYAVSGALVKQYNAINATNATLNLEINNGVYLMSVTTAKGTSTQKLMKK